MGLMSNHEFLASGDDGTKKLQEAVNTSTFALKFQNHISPIQVRLAKVGEKLLDFEVKYEGNSVLQFEIVMAIGSKRKLQEEYQNGQSPPSGWRMFSGKPAESTQILEMIQKKNKKAEKFEIFNRHLLVYVNLPGHLPDFSSHEWRILSSESKFKSIWLVKGDPNVGGIFLMSDAYGFPAIAKQIWLQ